MTDDTTEPTGDVNPNQGAIDAATADDPSVASTAKTAKQPRKAKAATATTAAVEPTGLRSFRCSVPQDPTLPPRVVQAMTVGDAEQVYRKEMGIVTLGFPITIADFGDAN